MTAGGPAPAPPGDTMRGLRGIGSAILVTHALVVGLAIPVVASRSGGAPVVAIAGLAAIAVLDLVAAGMMGRHEREVIVLGTVLQVATVVTGILSLALLFLGLVFGGLWVFWLSMRRSVLTTPPRPPQE